MNDFSIKNNNLNSVETSLDSYHNSNSNKFYLQNEKKNSRYDIDLFTFNTDQKPNQDQYENLLLFPNLTPKFGNKVNKFCFARNSPNQKVSKLRKKQKNLENLRNIINAPKKVKYGGNYLVNQMKKQATSALRIDSGLFSKNNSKLTSQTAENDTNDNLLNLKKDLKKIKSVKPVKPSKNFENKKFDKLKHCSTKRLKKINMNKNEMVSKTGITTHLQRQSNLLTINEYFLNKSTNEDSFEYSVSPQEVQATELSESFKQEFSNGILKSFKILQFCDQNKLETLLEDKSSSIPNIKKPSSVKKAPRVNIRYKSAQKPSLSIKNDKFKLFKKEDKQSFLKKEMDKMYNPSNICREVPDKKRKGPIELLNKLFW